MSTPDQAEQPIEASENGHKAPEKITLRLAPDVRLALEWMAAKKGVTLGEVIRQAISHEKFLTEEIDRGSAIVVEEKSGRIKQLVFM